MSLVLRDLQNPLIEVVSVKISSIYSQVSAIAYEKTLIMLKRKLGILFTACKNFRTIDKKQKFIYLDMEEYKDLRLTLEAFQETLSAPEFFSLSAGIALQSYIPDSLAAQEELTQWGKKRVLQGGGAIKIRIVKGANLGMERVEASIKNWPQAPFTTKAEVDANFIKMLHYGVQHAESVHIAIASHNIFDISYGLMLRAVHDLEQYISFKMLEGMCNHLITAVHYFAKNTLLYCPTVLQKDFHTAMAYLVRRLDENTQKDNFLTHLFEIESEPLAFINQKSRFERSVIEADHLLCLPRRTQDRELERVQPITTLFHNESDTDWSLPQNRFFLDHLIERWQKREFEIPNSIGSAIVFTKTRVAGCDPSRPGHRWLTYSLASQEDVERAIRYAKENSASWSKRSAYERSQVFRELARLLRQYRGELIMAIVAEVGKIFSEADSEVSEAIDFADFYARCLEEEKDFFHLAARSDEIAVVATPWNFPCSIATSSIIAPLAASRAVIFKPAQEAALVGFTLVELFYQAGVPREALQFIVCEDESVGSFLIKHPAVRAIMLTGATDTARLFMKMNPKARLFAETGGKNCAIVTKLSDRDLAVKEIIHSAFGYAGQKCSALSLAILDEEVYHDASFLQQLCDAAASLPCGSAWEYDTKINPLIRSPSSKLKKAMTTLERGEKWLLEPRIDTRNPQLVTPGIKLGIQRGSYMHTTELFGPILGVMAAKNLKEAVSCANGSSYGLTSGLFSLDMREHAVWLDSVIAGNCYINRSITGAVVQRQPFGGRKASSFGIGMKAGGKNYLLQLLDSAVDDCINERSFIHEIEHEFHSLIRVVHTEEDKRRFVQAVSSYRYWKDAYFSKTWECDQVIGEDNFLTYQPHDHIFVYVQEEDSLVDTVMLLAAARIAGCKTTLFGKKEGLTTYSEDRFLHLLQKDAFPRVRALSHLDDELLSKLSDLAYCIDISRPKPHGRLELLHFLHEVSVSSSYHRYGNLLHRDHEERNHPL